MNRNSISHLPILDKLIKDKRLNHIKGYFI